MRVKFLRLAAMVCLFAPPVAGAHEKPDVVEVPSCSSRPYPGQPGFAEWQRERDRQRAQTGYDRVCVRGLDWFDAHVGRARPMDVVMGRLAFEPVALESTPFRNFRLLGGVADRPVARLGASALRRVFRSPAGRVIQLEEWDMSLGGSVYRRPDLLTQRVNGAPAQLTILRTDAGRAVSRLSWIEGRRLFDLSIDEDVGSPDRKSAFLSLAESIPRSLPAGTRTPPDRSEPVLPGEPSFNPPKYIYVQPVAPKPARD